MSVDTSCELNEPLHDWSWSLGDGLLQLNQHGPLCGQYWWTGTFLDPRGICRVYSQSGFSQIDFAHGGRCFSRSWECDLGDYSLAQLARALITDVLAGAITR